MRLKALALLSALGATALPASAQSYGDCGSERGQNQVAGAILGGILGGVLGSNVAASGHRHDGTAVGAVLGGVVGSEIGRGSARCSNRAYGPSPREAYPVTSYPSTNYPATSYPAPYSPYPPSGYGGSAYPPPVGDYGYYPDGGHREGGYDDDDDDDDDDRGGKRKKLYARDRGDYTRSDDYAGRDCERATQITRLPDGAEIRRPVEACRDAYYGDWRIED